jgi:hypothetical protein
LCNASSAASFASLSAESQRDRRGFRRRREVCGGRSVMASTGHARWIEQHPGFWFMLANGVFGIVLGVRVALRRRASHAERMGVSRHRMWRRVACRRRPDRLRHRGIAPPRDARRGHPRSRLVRDCGAVSHPSGRRPSPTLAGSRWRLAASAIPARRRDRGHRLHRATAHVSERVATATTGLTGCANTSSDGGTPPEAGFAGLSVRRRLQESQVAGCRRRSSLWRSALW